MNSNQVNSEIKKYLELLGLEYNDKLPNMKELRRAYFSCANKQHPDKNAKLDSDVKKEKEEMLKRQINAYNTLAKIIFQQKINSFPIFFVLKLMFYVHDV